MELIKTKTELKEHLREIGYSVENYSIAVEALIFTDTGKLVLLQRTDSARDARNRLEGVGGSLKEENLLTGLKREIQEEIGDDKGDETKLSVSIGKLLEIRQVQFFNHRSQKMVDWIVVSHLCSLKYGTPFNREPNNHVCIRCLSLDELYEWQEEPIYSEAGKLIKPGLSKSLVMGRLVYKSKYGNKPYYEC